MTKLNEVCYVLGIIFTVIILLPFLEIPFGSTYMKPKKYFGNVINSLFSTLYLMSYFSLFKDSTLTHYLKTSDPLLITHIR